MKQCGRKKINRLIPKDYSDFCFKPCGIRAVNLEHIWLDPDEIEAIRLADYEAKYHEECAISMGVSRSTFSRILSSAHKKISNALLHQKALHIKNAKEEI
ncbi:MAG: DUF134 domain-containing protein [Sulfurovaceae bacterium]|nr:DUF134 domain-containing protein [Sulfurovaceae bacterium]MDD5548654.1 DUF134 domain-containing protein [Sulfurovaceae bacterium]